MRRVVLPADGHVHSEWSWDAPDGSMERTCARALDIGLPAVAFTEHAHDPTTLARGFAGAAAMAEAYGFRAGRHPFDLWPRSR
jgi:histidinol phosphatase-like PHP family hydrolase